MTALVSVETVLLVLLVVLVAGLLRSHAEILRRLGPPQDSDSDVPTPSAATGARDAVAAPAVSGVTPSGDVVSLAFEGADAAPTLLAFLTSGCGTCAGFWDSLGEQRLPPGIQTVIVAHGAERERPARLRSLGPVGVPVVMSSQAWTDYHVPGAPYFVLVNETIRGEGVATTWHAVASLVGDAIEDEREARAGAALSVARSGGSAGGGSGSVRARRIDETLAAAGIGPDHPSLFPGGGADEPGSVHDDASGSAHRT